MLNYINSETEMGDMSNEMSKEFFHMLNYLKPYEGDFYRNGKKIKNVRFYNEREWRFVPELFLVKDYNALLTKKGI